MRCPKCGYISYDHQDSCGSCKKDLSTIKNLYNGGVKKVAAPKFLIFGEEAASIAAQQQQINEDIEDEIYIDDEDASDTDIDISIDDDEDLSSLDLSGLDDLEELEDISFDEDSKPAKPTDDLVDEDFSSGLDLDFSDDDDDEAIIEDEGIVIAPLEELDDLPPATNNEKLDDLNSEEEFDFSFDDLDSDEPTDSNSIISEDEIELDESNFDVNSSSDENIVKIEDLSEGEIEKASTSDIGSLSMEDIEDLSLDEIELSLPTKPKSDPTNLKKDSSADMGSALDFELDLTGLELESVDEPSSK